MTEGKSVSELLANGHLMLRSCPLHSQVTRFPKVQSTKPCLPPRMSQPSKLAAQQQIIVEGEEQEAALTITAQRGLSPCLCLHSARTSQVLVVLAGVVEDRWAPDFLGVGRALPFLALFSLPAESVCSRHLCSGAGENLSKHVGAIPSPSASDKFLQVRAVEDDSIFTWKP